MPIFNPLNNRGDDAYLFGELDNFGGHCGRADDYHYHLAPVHLEKTIGKGLPIAYALDGYPSTATANSMDRSRNASMRSMVMTLPRSVITITPQRPIRISTAGFTARWSSVGDRSIPNRAEPVREAGTPLRGAHRRLFQSETGQRSADL